MKDKELVHWCNRLFAADDALNAAHERLAEAELQRNQLDDYPASQGRIDSARSAIQYHSDQVRGAELDVLAYVRGLRTKEWLTD